MYIARSLTQKERPGDVNVSASGKCTRGRVELRPDRTEVLVGEDASAATLRSNVDPPYPAKISWKVYRRPVPRSNGSGRSSRSVRSATEKRLFLYDRVGMRRRTPRVSTGRSIARSRTRFFAEKLRERRERPETKGANETRQREKNVMLLGIKRISNDRLNDRFSRPGQTKREGKQRERSRI